MHLVMRQQAKELFEATFVIGANNMQIGDMRITSQISRVGGDWTINYSGTQIALKRGKNFAPKEDKPFRPYDIYVNNEGVGSVYQKIIKEGGPFSDEYPVFVLWLNGVCYTLYPVCFGEEGAKSPVYCNGVQVAEVHKAAVIYDDLHEYNIYMYDRQYGLACILLCAHSYDIGFYKNGEKITKGYYKKLYTTTDKELLEKYNPAFMAGLYGQP